VREVVGKLADGGPVLRDLLLVGTQLCLKLPFALQIVRLLQRGISSLRRRTQRRIEIALPKLGLAARDLRFEARDLQSALTSAVVNVGSGREAGRSSPARPLAHRGF
jgi:hypothetical protein